MASSFAHLHVHSHYSLMRGTERLEALADAARQRGMDRFALTDTNALYGFVFLNPWLVLAYWGGFNVVQLALATYAFRLDREPLRPLWALPLQQFVYRQFMYAVIVQSVLAALAGVRLRWHKMERTGVGVPPASTPG